ncbi:MAG: hypothetical protein A3G25_03625 [Betaproteobacteria bacterium RIFCSPLOWO2_12_FULL_63_13]|nr:MAG: hypothetical protein A3G25_03625 [Betaproteobacteria bacterium RIFCSPLOWO2_12_FULL_63_13]
MFKKEGYSFNSVLQFLTATLLVGLTAIPATAQAVELRYATFHPTVNNVYKRAVLPFVDRVAKATGGAVTIKTYPGGQLANIKTTITALRNGTADAGVLIPIFVPSEVPSHNALQQVLFAGANPIAAAGASVETVVLGCPGCRKDLEAAGAVSVLPVATTAYRMQCAKDVPNTASLKGRKIRIVGGAQKTLLQELGATRVVVPPADVMEGMNRGVLDCAVTPLPWLVQFSLKESVHYIIDEPLGYARTIEFFVLRKASWEKLSPEQRRTVFKEFPQLAADSVIEGYLYDDERVIKVAKDKGIKFIKPDAAFTKAVDAARAAEKEVAFADAKKRKVPNFPAVWAHHQRALAKWAKLSRDIGTDPKKFAQALWDNVYSKIDPLTMLPK